MIADQTMFTEWERNSGSTAIFVNLDTGFDIHEGLVPACMAQRTGSAHVSWTLTDGEGEERVDIGPRVTEIEGNATYAGNTLKLNDIETETGSGDLGIYVRYYKWEWFDVENADERFDSDATYHLSLRIEHDPALYFHRFGRDLDEIEAKYTDRPDPEAITTAFAREPVTAKSYSTTLSEITESAHGVFRDETDELTLGRLPVAAFPRAIAFPGTHYELELGFAPTDEVFLEGASNQYDSFTAFEATVEAVDEDSVTFSLDAPTDHQRLLDQSGEIRCDVTDVPVAFRAVGAKARIAVNLIYDTDRTDEKAVIPTTRRIPGTELTVDYNGVLTHDDSTERSFSHEIERAIAHDDGVLLLFDTDTPDDPDADVAVDPNRNILRVDDTGTIDWIVEAPPEDESFLCEDLVCFDGRLFASRIAAFGAEIDPRSGEILHTDW